LLTQHRIRQRIGGAGLHTVPENTIVAERKEIGEQIARYRRAALVWCHQAMRAANLRINLEGSTGGTRGPAEKLRYRLDAAISADRSGLPTMEELVAGQGSVGGVPGSASDDARKHWSGEADDDVEQRGELFGQVIGATSATPGAPPRLAEVGVPVEHVREGPDRGFAMPVNLIDRLREIVSLDVVLPRQAPDVTEVAPASVRGTALNGTVTSASSTPPPASSSANSTSTHRSTTRAPGARRGPPAEMKEGRTHNYWVRPSAMS